MAFKIRGDAFIEENVQLDNYPEARNDGPSDKVLYTDVTGNLLLGRYERPVCQVKNSDSTTNLNTAAFTPVPINGNVTINRGGFTFSTNGIIVPEDGVYECSFSVFMQAFATRVALRGQIYVNGSPRGAMAAMGYIRNTGGHNESSITNGNELVNLNAGEDVTVHLQREADSTGATTMGFAFSSLLNLRLT